MKANSATIARIAELVRALHVDPPCRLERSDFEVKGWGQNEKDLRKQVVDAVVCFTNADGGLIFVGPENAQTIRHVRQCPYPGVSAEWLSDQIHKYTHPPVQCKVYSLWNVVNDLPPNVASCFVVDVPRRQIPSKHTTHAGVCLVRHLDSCEVDHLAFQDDFSAVIMDQARLDDLDAASMEWAFTSSIKPRSTQRWRTSGRNAIDLLVDFGLATVDEGGDLSLTLACLLLFGKASALKLWADGGTFVRVTVAETGRDPYSQLFEHNIASLLRSLHTRQGLFWSMLSQTAPHECLWELIVNSLMHRNYRLSGPVHIRIVPGHLIEIHNPGGLLRHLKPDTLINGSPVHRNHLLSEAASLLSFCEKSGSGIDLVYYNALCEGLDFPEFLQDGESFGALIPLERRTDFANFLLRRGNEFTVLESILILRHLYTRSAANLDELARVTQRPCAMALTVVRDLERRNVVREAGNGNWTLSTEVLDDMNNPVHSLQRGLFD